MQRDLLNGRQAKATMKLAMQIASQVVVDDEFGLRNATGNMENLAIAHLAAAIFLRLKMCGFQEDK